jgi:hypothetical protein
MQTWEFWFYLSLPVYIVGAWTISNWLTDTIYIKLRILENKLHRERKWKI